MYLLFLCALVSPNSSSIKFWWGIKVGVSQESSVLKEALLEAEGTRWLSCGFPAHHHRWVGSPDKRVAMQVFMSGVPKALPRSLCFLLYHQKSYMLERKLATPFKPMQSDIEQEFIATS